MIRGHRLLKGQLGVGQPLGLWSELIAVNILDFRGGAYIFVKGLPLVCGCIGGKFLHPGFVNVERSRKRCCPECRRAPFVHLVINCISCKVIAIDGGSDNYIAKGAPPAIFGIALDQSDAAFRENPAIVRMCYPRSR